MSHEELRDLMVLYLLGELEDAERGAVRAGLESGDPRYAGCLAEAEALLAKLSLGLEPVMPGAGAKEKLMARVAAGAARGAGVSGATGADRPGLRLGGEGMSGGPAPVRWGELRPLGWAIAAAVAALVTWGVAYYGPMQRQWQEIERVRAALAVSEGQITELEHGQKEQAERFESELASKTQRIEQLEERQRLEAERFSGELALRETQIQELQGALQATREELASKAARLEQLEGVVAAANRTIQVLRARKLIVASLEGGESQPGAWGRVFWDQENQVWHFYAAGLRPAGPGKTYELWFITADQAKVPAGTFDVNPAGEGALTVSVPATIGTIALAAVTDEPAGGVPQPTGSIQLAGPIP